MSKHSHIDPCCKELRGIIVSYTPPACQDVVWLQPVKPGLFRWMIPSPHRNGTWTPVAVEQPIPKNALLEYFYNKIQEGEGYTLRFYSESDTEAILGSYLYDEDGNFSMQGTLDFHCDADSEDRISFSQTVTDFEKGCSTYIKQFYDRIILSIESPDGEHNITLNKDGLFYDNSQVITKETLKDNAISSVTTVVEPTIYNNNKYNLIHLTTEQTDGEVTITGSIDQEALTSLINQLIEDGKITIDSGIAVTSENYSGVVTIESNASIVTGTISGSVRFRYSSVPKAKQETHFILQSDGDTTVSFPSSDNYIITDSNETHTLTDGQWLEINYISDGNRVYIRSAINE